MVGQVRRHRGVAVEVQLAGDRVGLRVRGHRGAQPPAEVAGPDGAQVAVDLVRQALLDQGEQPPAVLDDVGVGRHGGEVDPAPGQEAPAGERAGAHPPVAVPARAARLQPHAVEHPVARGTSAPGRRRAAGSARCARTGRRARAAASPRRAGRRRRSRRAPARSARRGGWGGCPRRRSGRPSRCRRLTGQRAPRRSAPPSRRATGPAPDGVVPARPTQSCGGAQGDAALGEPRQRVDLGAARRPDLEVQVRARWTRRGCRSRRSPGRPCTFWPSLHVRPVDVAVDVDRAVGELHPDPHAEAARGAGVDDGAVRRRRRSGCRSRSRCRRPCARCPTGRRTRR